MLTSQNLLIFKKFEFKKHKRNYHGVVFQEGIVYIMFEKDQSHSFMKFCANEFGDSCKIFSWPFNILNNEYFEGIIQDSGVFIAMFLLG